MTAIPAQVLCNFKHRSGILGWKAAACPIVHSCHAHLHEESHWRAVSNPEQLLLLHSLVASSLQRRLLASHQADSVACFLLECLAIQWLSADWPFY